MALIKKTNFKGIDAEYWKITGSITDFLNPSLKVIIVLYKDRNSRNQNENNHLLRKVIRLDTIDNNRENVYDLLKKTQEFENATDDEDRLLEINRANIEAM